MSGNEGAVILVGLLLAVLVTLFWRVIAYLAVVFLIAVVFIGILTIVLQSNTAFNGG